MKYWNSNRKSCEHVEPREDWKESIELWIDWMEAIGRTEETLRTRWYQIVRFSKIVNKSKIGRASCRERVLRLV